LQIFDKPDNLIPECERAVGLGFFDGVHRGHIELLRTLAFLGKEQNLLPAVFTFPAHPETILQPDDPFTDYLSDLPARLTLIGECGVAEVHLQPFDQAFAAMEPEHFLEKILAERLRARLIVVGEDYRFGRGGRGDIDFLRQWAEPRQIQLVVIPQVRLAGGKVSSSRIRELIGAGKLDQAAFLLGRPYRLAGTVVTGRRLGHSLGFPTANIPVPSYVSCPAFGVYATRTTVAGRAYNSVTNIGLRPTVDLRNSQPLIETHLFDFALNLYGQEIQVDFLERIRPEQQFASVEAMGEQVRLDLARVREWHDRQEQAYELARCGDISFQIQPTRRFAQSSLHLVFYSPLEAKASACQNLLMRVLTASCRRYPSRTALAAALDRNYGATIEANLTKEGDLQEIDLAAEAIMQWTDGTSPFRETCELLFDLLFEPLLDDEGLFDEAIVEAERQNLLLEIAARENDRAKYAYDRCLAAFCGSRVQGLPPAGGSEPMARVTRRDLADAYQSLLTGSSVILYLVGRPDPATLESCLAGISRFPAANRPEFRPALFPSPFVPEPAAELVEYKSIEQARIVLAYSGMPPYFSQQSAQATVLNSMLGGDVHSLLFDVVREQLGLAYSVYSMSQRCLSALFVLAGVAPAQVDAACAAIKRQVADLAAGRFDQALFDRSLQMVETALLSAGDEIAVLASRLIKGRLYGRFLHIDMLREVKPADIVALAGRLKLVTRYVLTTEPEAGSSPAGQTTGEPADAVSETKAVAAAPVAPLSPVTSEAAAQARAKGPAWQSVFTREERIDAMTGVVLRTYRHRDGLLVKMLPRPGFSRRFAAVTVPFGSIYTRFRAGRAVHRVPPGTAHFLEHCLFSRDDGGGLTGRLSDLGASANAYTTHSHTQYYFSTVHHFAEALDLYLDAIFEPYLGLDRVEAERPVILAELDQYLDDPDTRIYMKLVENLFARHPVRQDIGGTRESVSAITPDDLEKAWRHFYQPNHVMLTLAGDLDEDDLLDRVAARLAARRQPVWQPGRLLLPHEPAGPSRITDSLQMDVAAPSFLVGFKDPDLNAERRLGGQELAMRQKTGQILLESLLSPASPLFDSLYEAGLINDSFGFHYACEDSFAFLVCGGESDRPEEAAAAVRDGLVECFCAGGNNELFEIQKRAAAGDFVGALDSIEHSGMIQAQCNLQGIDLFDYPGLYDKMDNTAASRMLAFLGDSANCSIAALHPEVK
jgi:riboflavin kinase / FMN adenylyltransferase